MVFVMTSTPLKRFSFGIVEIRTLLLTRSKIHYMLRSLDTIEHSRPSDLRYHEDRPTGLDVAGVHRVPSSSPIFCRHNYPGSCTERCRVESERADKLQ